MMIKLIDKKKEFRKKQYALRKKLFSNVKKVFDKDLFEELFKKVNFKNINIISSFISINSEIDTYELNNYIIKKNRTLCLPVIIKKNNHLIFKKFTKKSNLVEGFFKIQEPIASSETLIPDLIFVPCLAFDKLGYRIGYGGGYYDRTFSYLKKIKKKFISVGYAFDDQKVLEVPKDSFDMRLNYVITENSIYSFK